MVRKQKQGAYYLGRTIFFSELTKPKFVEALKAPVSIESARIISVVSVQRYDY